MTGEVDNYTKFRGKCKEMSEAAIAADPTLRLVRGHYFCPLWASDEPHWWTVRPDGTIHDPTKLQFPSAGAGIYTEFDGYFDCEHCGDRVLEAEAYMVDHHVYCTSDCYARDIGF